MRYLLLVNIYADLPALKACILTARRERFDRILVLGNIVGKGKQADECIALLRTEKHCICLQGSEDADQKNHEGRMEEHPAWLSELPKFFSTPFLLAVHGTPFDPLQGKMDEAAAQKTLESVSEKVTICAAIKEPFVYTKQEGMQPIGQDKTILLDRRMVIALPPVSQPKDGDERAGYAILDFERKQLFVRRIKI